MLLVRIIDIVVQAVRLMSGDHEGGRTIRIVIWLVVLTGALLGLMALLWSLMTLPAHFAPIDVAQ